nr:invasion associated locus B family protein [Shinella sp. NM-101]
MSVISLVRVFGRLTVFAVWVASGVMCSALSNAAAVDLPGGASSLSETHKDWMVSCAQDRAATRCVISQVQTRQDGQRVLAVELNAPDGDTVSGMVILPFGLALDPGVTLQIDDKPAMPALRFRTCLPGGCLVTIAFDAPALTALRAGGALKLVATADGGGAVPFSVSLQGFAAALDRATALVR